MKEVFIVLKEIFACVGVLATLCGLIYCFVRYIMLPLLIREAMEEEENQDFEHENK